MKYWSVRGIYHSKIIHKNVTLGRVNEVVICPERGKIVGIRVRGRWCTTHDVTKLERSKIHVSEVVTLRELPVVQRILASEVKIMRANVLKNGATIGRVRDVLCAKITGEALAIEVTRGHFWWRRSWIVQRNKIERIDHKGVHIVADNLPPAEKNDNERIESIQELKPVMPHNASPSAPPKSLL